MRAALAINCTVHEHSRFAAAKIISIQTCPRATRSRNTNLPLATGGWLEIEIQGEKKRIGITRLHLEEDAGKSLHDGFPHSGEKTYVDFNRCGTPLSEIVSEPDMRTPDEAYAYLTTLRQILLYTGVSDVNMEEGSLRCDANVSVRRPRRHRIRHQGGSEEPQLVPLSRQSPRIRNRAPHRHHRIRRPHLQETRLWNQAANRTDTMRSKEKVHDYRYFPEPDLLPVHVSPAWRDEVLRTLPKSPSKTREEFIQKYSMSPYDAGILTTTKKLAEYFNEVLDQPFWVRKDAKLAANWIQNEFLRLANEFGKSVEKNEWPPQAEAAVLLQRIQEKILTAASAKKVLANMFEKDLGVDEAVRAVGGTTPLLDTSEILKAAQEVMEKNPDNVAKFKSGNEGVFKFFVGQVMKATKGQANPQAVNDIVRRLLS